MNRDDIIRMAREADPGFEVDDLALLGVLHHAEYLVGMEAIERFAALVAAAEREACAQLCESNDAAWTETYSPRSSTAWNDACHTCAAAIRDRGININSEYVNISMSIEEMAKKLRNNK